MQCIKRRLAQMQGVTAVYRPLERVPLLVEVLVLQGLIWLERHRKLCYLHVSVAARRDESGSLVASSVEGPYCLSTYRFV
jgi:hypothetical protein